MDHYRLVGHTGRLAAVLITSAALAPLGALSVGVSSAFSNIVASTEARALTHAQPTTVPQVTLSICANLVGRCGCVAKTAFHRGETVNLLMLSSAMPRLNVQVEPSGQPSTRVNTKGAEAGIQCVEGRTGHGP